MSLATSTVKCILLVFNFIFALSSLGICFLGFILYSKAATLRDVTGGQLAILSSVLIVTGAIVFFVAFFGCCGVVRESHCMIVFYTALLLVIFLTEACLGVVALVNKTSLESSTEQSLNKILADFYDNTEKRTFFDRMQTDLHCCGVSGPPDWKDSIPLSCCNLENGKRSYCTQEEIYMVGCRDIVAEQAKGVASHIAVVAMGVAFIKIVGIIFSLCLINSIRNDKRRGYA
ncbi:hypothetical protein M8J75_007351 [Diaphorina citri]|nr:hypothetical protein M8J75_007351 [Diaphorina citri]